VYPKKCAECGGSVEVSSDPIPFDIRGESVLVGGIEHGQCVVCGESYLSLDATERLQKEAVRLLSAVRTVRTVRAVDAVGTLQRKSVARGANAFTEDDIDAEIATTRAARYR